MQNVLNLFPALQTFEIQSPLLYCNGIKIGEAAVALTSREATAEAKSAATEALLDRMDCLFDREKNAVPGLNFWDAMFEHIFKQADRKFQFQLKVLCHETSCEPGCEPVVDEMGSRAVTAAASWPTC